MTSGSRRVGRPRKFSGPSRVVTITLPEATISKLANIDEDRALAIVEATERALPGDEAGDSRVDVVKVGENVGMITVPRCAALQDVPGLTLARISPSRHLLVLDESASFARIELTLADRLEEVGTDQGREREILRQLLAHIRSFRRADRVSLAEVILVEVD